MLIRSELGEEVEPEDRQERMPRKREPDDPQSLATGLETEVRHQEDPGVLA